MNFIQFLGALQIGLLFGLVAIGVWLSFRILDFPDLTVDGSFPLGAAVASTAIVSGLDPFTATLLAVIAGMMAGFVTAWISTRWNILHLLASILTMISLYSINIRIMGRPNTSLLGETTIFDALQIFGLPPYENTIVLMGIITLLAAILVKWFLSTQLGMGMRATGSNPKMAQAQGISNHFNIKLGISISNGLVALAGALFAQSEGFADVTMGVGTIIIGLAAVIVGEAILNPKTIAMALVSCIIGAIFYRLAISFSLNLNFIGLQASDINLITALLVGFAMITPRLRQKLLDFRDTRNSK